MESALVSSQAQADEHQRLFTRGEYHAMAESGILGPEDRVELINGKVIAMMPLGPWHGSSTDRLADFLRNCYGKTAIVACGRPLALSASSEPQPDISVLHRRFDYYADAHPEPRDVLLVIEVADSSRTFDLGTKLDLYAAHGVSEYWVVDGVRKCIHVFQQPVEGMFKFTRLYHPGEILPLPGLEGATLAVTDAGL
jgi:Uma2 family endonuclease